MNIILVDLKKHNQARLKEMAKFFDWNEDVLIKFKVNGIHKIWVDLETQDVISYTMKNSEELQFGHKFLDQLKSLKPIDWNQLIEINTLSLDKILDKISANGIESLTDIEKAYLDSQSEG